jgi:hypothetical protein
MLAALTLVVFVSGEPEAADVSLGEAARQFLGANASVSVRPSAAPPADAALTDLLASAHVDAVATIVWSSADPPSAAIRLYSGATQHWIGREIQFSEGDASGERARTIGYALGCMLPASEAETEAPAATQAAQAPDVEHDLESSSASARSRAAQVMIDAAANAGLALGGAGDGFGGTLGVQVELSPRLALRADLGARAGHFERLEADILALDVAPGVAWRLLDRPWHQPIAVELRLAFMARYQSITREEGAVDGAESRGRWLPGARAGVAGLWWFSSEWALLATASLDSVSDETWIRRNGVRAAQVQPLALLMQLGVRAHL